MLDIPLILFLFTIIAIAFIFHKYLPKKICRDRKELSNVLIEFLFQTFGYTILPFFIIYNINHFYSPQNCPQNSLYTFLLLTIKPMVNYLNIFTLKNIILIIALYTLSIPFLISGLRFENLRKEYPLWRNFYKTTSLKKILYIFVYLIYYINWEFLFRGVFLLLLLQSTNPYQTHHIFFIFNIIQSIFAGLFHYDKPLPEFILSFPTNFIFGYIAYGFNSIVPCIIIHYLIGVTFDLLVTYVKVKK